MALVREAVWAEQALDIAYRDGAGAGTRRRIWPLSIVFLDRSLMCLAHCRLRGAFRRFHLGRMEEVALAAESFRPRRVALLREMLADMRARKAGAG